MKKHLAIINIVAVILFVVGFIFFSSSLAVTLYVINRGHINSPSAYAANGDIPWQIFDGGGDSSGNNTNETKLTTANAHSLAKLWQVATPDDVDSGVVEQPDVTTSQGTMDLVFVNTIKGQLAAYNAWTGTKIWEADPSAANYNGQGTKSTPAIDPSGNFIYAYALDGYIHKYNISTGAEVTGTGFPAQITLLANNIEKGSASINIANGYLYMTISGNDGDYGHYIGHVVAVNLSTGVKTVWNAECSNITQLQDATSSHTNYCADTESGIWARPGVKVDPVSGNVFFATGNGKYNANTGGKDWGDSIIELTPNLGTIVDSYTPTNFATLDSADEDLGSTAPVLLPTQSGSNTPYMLVQAGKDNTVRLVNRSNMSGAGGPGHTGGQMQAISISNEVHEQPAEWTDGSGNAWVFVTDESGDFYAYKLVTTGGVSTLVQQYKKTGIASSSPFVANGVVYLDGNSILALNATTGATLYDSTSQGIGINEHWASPTVVNGLLFTADYSGNLYALYVPGTSVVPPTIPAGLHSTAQTSSSISMAWSASSDPSGPGIAGYKVYRAGTLIATLPGSSSLSYTDTGLASGTVYNYTVTAYDTSGAESGKSVSVGLSTTGTAGTTGDLNNDGHVNITDLSIFLSHWGTTDAACDLNHSGTVEIGDLSMLLSHWG
ncbi:MAG TPA: PQQ-binding-like beta-propeller repeat protein [Candidatus Saccharimonadales bacterium]|nr:PQQ-binding-like beta-propeller repeat protein [Candidatus Saccharimonadales bacterium]